MNAKFRSLFPFVLVTALTLSLGALLAAPTDPALAAAAVTGWLANDPTPLGEALPHDIKRIDTYTDNNDTVLYHIVYLDPEGFVIVSGDDQVEPIIAFVRAGSFDPSSQNPLGAMVSKDMPERLSAVWAAAGDPPGRQAEILSAQDKWDTFARAATNPMIEAYPNISGMRVPPMLVTRWSQQTAGGYGVLACYNYYTPPYGAGNVTNYPCGCVATAMAQLMRYHQFPVVGVGTNSFRISVDAKYKQMPLRGGNGAGGPYDWADMIPDPKLTPPTSIQREAIGALCFDAGVASNMQYSKSASGTYALSAKNALQVAFLYPGAVLGTTNGIRGLGDGLIGMINPNLDARCPVLLSITGFEGHEVVCDGYGFSGSTLYHHLNMGWSGFDDAWYALPIVNTTQWYFSVIAACIYNIFPDGTGEIISGRVVDSVGAPVPGASVKATAVHGGTYSATTDTNGIYALAKIPSLTGYSLTVSKTGFIPSYASFYTGQSIDQGSVSGNVAGADITLIATRPLDHFLWNQLARQTANCPFAVSIAARDAANGPAFEFTGTVTLSATGQAGGAVLSLPILPPVTPAFVSGVWTGTVTVTMAASNVVLRADDRAGHVGLSNPFNLALPLAQLSIDLYNGITLQGELDTTWRIEWSPGSPDGPWTPLASVRLTDTTQVWVDTTTTANSHRVYRAIPVQ